MTTKIERVLKLFILILTIRLTIDLLHRHREEEGHVAVRGALPSDTTAHTIEEDEEDISWRRNSLQLTR